MKKQVQSMKPEDKGLKTVAGSQKSAHAHRLHSSFYILHSTFGLALLLAAYSGVAATRLYAAATPSQAASSNAPASTKKTNPLATAGAKQVTGAREQVTGPDTPHRAPGTLAIPKSHFGTDLAMGKDPFYPETARFQLRIPLSQTNQVVAVAPEVRINGFSGNAARPLVILNNVTFGEGDEQMVMTVSGRARVRCVAIRMQEQAAEIEINGQRRELKFQGRK